MTRVEAERIVRQYLKAKERDAGCELTVIEAETIERDFGWIFFYDSRLHLESGEFRHAIAGNAPIVVTKKDGRAHETGTAYPLEHYLEKFNE